MDTQVMLRDFGKIMFFLLLILGLLFAATWTGVMKCKTIPAWCDIYYAFMGKPKVLIVYGSEGLGDPFYLQQVLGDPNHLGVRAEVLNVNSVNLGNLKNYGLVIVEKSKKISTAKLRNFMQYVDEGGRLIWTGDAGTELGEKDELLYEDEKALGKPHEIINVWARKDGTDIVAFNEFIAANYKANYCSIKTCSGLKKTFAGALVPIDREHPLVNGISTNIPLYVFEKEDFAIVQTSELPSTIVMELDYGSNLYDKSGKDLGSTSPMIITTGFGEKTAYYAMPLEYFANSKLEDKYYGIIENMYLGMIKG